MVNKDYLKGYTTGLTVGLIITTCFALLTNLIK